ncbi:hypothetical protein XA68_10369 [Ophiocordyceps unilateralis]|uniref:AB hydrolase-1 domain-containing protein n=1 Tax=Ophiocordyceps unilateralis TaxID=268505 RepID=A0A2A9PGY4_OPHUN|nr:hypothetical protein XA68_10369 [Ophiocordyceps unilateralis]
MYEHRQKLLCTYPSCREGSTSPSSHKPPRPPTQGTGRALSMHSPEKLPFPDGASSAAVPRGPTRGRPAAGTWSMRCILTLTIIAAVKRLSTGVSASDTVSPIEWEACPSRYPSHLDCARLAVPLDHNCRRSNRQRIRLGMVRAKATASKPLGNLVLNPGGPGSSIVEIFVKGRQDEVVGPELLHHYNVIAPDPRGVGISSPIQCNASDYNRRVPSYMASQADLEARVAWNRALGESCAAMTGPLLQHVDTVSVAKDLDYIRKALGDEKLNFMGISYGTQLGSQYAELYPDRVGKMVLDGVLDHSQNSIDSLMTEAVSYEDSLKGFFQWCNTTTDCAFHGQDLSSIFDKLVDGANEKSIPAPGCLSPGDAIKTGGVACASEVTGYELIANAQDDISQSSLWISLSKSLREAREGNATRLSSRLATDDTSFGFAPFSHTAISCLDWKDQAQPGAGKSLMARLMAARVLTPHTRGLSETLDIQTSCIGWPAPARNPPRRLSRERLARAPPILLVSAFHDPSTSVTWALGLREQMPTAVNIFRDGFGHTSYWDYGDTQKAIDSFFINGDMPADLAVFKT